MDSVREYETRHAPGGWRSATSSLYYPQFRWIYLSNVAFFFAMNGQFVVRSYLAFKLTDSAFALGLVNLAVAVPMLVVSPFGGVVADRVEKRRLIMIGQAAVVLNEAVVLVLLIAGVLAFWHMLVASFAMGCIFPFMMPARQSIVASIVGRQGLANAMALSMGGMNAARVAGPVLAGSMIAVIGLRSVYAVALLLYLGALLAMSRVDRSPPAEERGDRGVFGDIADGFRYVRDDPPVRALMLLSLVPILLAMPFQMLLVVFAEDVWDVGSSGLGILQAVAGVGGILGSVYVAWRGDTRRKVRTMIASLLAFGGTLFLFAISPWFLLALPLVLVSDVFASVFSTVNGTAIQLLVPDAVRGRVMALMMMTFGLTPLGTLPVSAVAQAWGAPAAVAGSAVATVVVSVAFYLLSSSLRTVDAASNAALEADLREARARGRPTSAARAAS
jgi:MFS family permease